MVGKSIPPCKEAGSGRTGRTPGIINPENLETCCSSCSQTTQACFLLTGVLQPLEIPLYNTLCFTLFYIHQLKHRKWQQLAYQQTSISFVLESLVWGERGARQALLLYPANDFCQSEAHELSALLPDLAGTGQWAQEKDWRISEASFLHEGRLKILLF